ncbi:hypothetical protein A9267_17145 [Shewanella sp. UCD-FRSSP16_17]|uniref:outer membrane beta-barrel protein n=1 Tax=Shewanella sp. UCD-FRSSP16_17 TaxID=1853256 RepID=UPI0007EEDF32|nr:outer membrane beta-barrel protein [Shewanella sp. UCD-FRSSP16_17]OBT04675.1 hypothetical protein A9267_17145 [Shewanella sp. UCD-FRSSP16_17]
MKNNIKLQSVIALSWVMSACCVASNDDIEVGLKLSFQQYQNNLTSPSTFAYGLFFNTSINQDISLEAGLYSFGEAQELNGNKGGFFVGELSALYHFDLNNDDPDRFFVKAGLSPWVGYLTTPADETNYDFGFSPILGAGYQFSMSDDWSGRIEYQYFPNLGKDNVGQADSHLLSFSFICCSAPNKVHYSSAKPVIYPKPQEVKNLTRHTPKVDVINVVKQEKELASVQREIFGSWYFDNNSSQLHITYPMGALNKAREYIQNDCKLGSIKVYGYTDGTGEADYNAWLANKRARRVKDYIKGALGGQLGTAEVKALGAQREHALLLGNVAPYERRVDYVLLFSCK